MTNNSTIFLTNDISISVINDSLRIIFYFQTLLLLVVALYCLAANSVFVWFLRILKVLPTNLKQFMLILTCAVICQSVYIVGHTIYNLFYGMGMTVDDQGRDILIRSGWACPLVQCINITCIATIVTAAFAIGYELAYASYLDKKLNSGEEWSKPHFSTYVASGLVWSTNSFPCIAMFLYPVDEMSHQYCYFTLIIEPRFSIPISIFMVVVELATISLFVYTYRIHSRFTFVKTTLGDRFKAQQSLDLSKSFLVWCSLQSCTYVISVLLRMVSGFFQDDISLFLTVSLITFNFQFYALFNVFNPYLQIKKNKMMRRRILQRFSVENQDGKFFKAGMARFLLTWSKYTKKVNDHLCVNPKHNSALEFYVSSNGPNSKSVQVFSSKEEEEGPVDYRVDPNQMKEMMEKFWTVKPRSKK